MPWIKSCLCQQEKKKSPTISPPIHLLLKVRPYSVVIDGDGVTMSSPICYEILIYQSIIKTLINCFCSSHNGDEYFDR